MDRIPRDRTTMLNWIMHVYEFMYEDPREHRHCAQIMISHIRWPFNVSQFELEQRLERLLYREEFGRITKLNVRKIRDAGGNDNEETIGFLEYERSEMHYKALYYFSHQNVTLFDKTLWFRPCGFTNDEDNYGKKILNVKCNFKIDMNSLHLVNVNDFRQWCADNIPTDNPVTVSVNEIIAKKTKLVDVIDIIEEKKQCHICVYSKCKNEVFRVSSYLNNPRTNINNRGLNRMQTCLKNCVQKQLKN